MNRKGFVLIELLVASVLLSIAGTGLCAGLMQGFKADRTLRDTNALYDPLRILWMKAGKDLRNASALRDYRFTGKQDEMIFPVLVTEKKETDTLFHLRRIHYFVKDGNLIRNEEELPESFVKEEPPKRILLEGIEQFRFQYAYLDEEERLTFKSFWMEEPYFGIPKAVKIDVKLKQSEKTFSRLVPIPQGRWGHVQVEEEAGNE